MEVIRIVLLVIQGLISVAFVFLVATQTSKNEGFGTIGVQTPANFKGMPGYEERMQQYTRNVGIAWFAVAVLVALAYR